MLSHPLSPERAAKLAALHNAAIDARTLLNLHLEECIAQEAPAKPGDIVTVTGYSFQGKRMQVKTLHLSLSARGLPTWHAHGPVLKKNGLPGEQIGEACWGAE